MSAEQLRSPADCAPTWTPKIMALCADDCAEAGDPPCWRLGKMDEGGEFVTATFNGEELRPCDECRARANMEEEAS